MNIDSILIAMEEHPRSFNRRNREFCHSVEWELKRCKSPQLAQNFLEARNLFLVSTIKGVYVDYDMGDYDTVVYLANSVALETGLGEMPNKWWLAKDADELKKAAEMALFSASLPQARAVSQDLPSKGMCIRIGESEYAALGRIDSSRTRVRRYREISRNFRQYSDALGHTIHEYLWACPQ